MKKKSVLLSDRRIEGYDLFKEVDPYVFQKLINALKKNNFKISHPQTKMNKIFFAFNAFGYRISSGRLAWATPQNTTDWITVYHDGIHNLVGLKFGVKLPGRPLMTLLNECVGLGLGLYHTLNLHSLKGLNFNELGIVIDLKSTSKTLGVSFNKELTRALRNPFQTYKDVVTESFANYSRMLRVLESPTSNPKRATKALIDGFKNSKNYLFYYNGNPIVPILFVAANCGFKSSKNDTAAVKECLKILKASKSMEDFLRRLGADKL